jgi:hypothetical protein
MLKELMPGYPVSLLLARKSFPFFVNQESIRVTGSSG